MGLPPGWKRVSRHCRCTICGKPDWCIYNESKNLACCPRVWSDRPFGSAGYLHDMNENGESHNGKVLSFSKRVVPARIDFKRLSHSHFCAISNGMHRCIEEDMAPCSSRSMRLLGIGWSDVHDAWSFPMRDGDGKCVGIRLRRRDGRKFAVGGSRNGLFIPSMVHEGGPILVCEGPTDTAVALDLGFYAIGRASCSSGAIDACRFIRNHGAAPVVIVADADGPGVLGARRLAEHLGNLTDVAIIRPRRGKDLREWVASGATNRDLRLAIENATWKTP